MNKEYLTGFRKRKQERRKFGLAMQIMKEKKVLKEARKSIRNSKAALNAISIDKYTGTENNNDDNGTINSEDKIERVTFDDDHTRSLFQGGVTVKIGTGIADDLDDRYGNPYKGDNDEEGEGEGTSDTEQEKKNQKSSNSSSSRNGHMSLIDDDETNLRKWQEKQRLKAANEPSNFDKAMKLAKIKMGKGKGHSTGSDVYVDIFVCICVCISLH